MHAAYSSPVKLLTTSSDPCSQADFSYTWIQNRTQDLGYLLFKEAISDSGPVPSTLPSLPSTHLGLQLLLNVKNSTALKFKTHHIWKTIFIFPMSHSFSFSYSGDAKTPAFFEKGSEKLLENVFFEAPLDFGNKL